MEYFAEAASKLLTGKEEFLDTKVNGENKYYVSYPVAGTTWVLLLEVPKKRSTWRVLSSLSIIYVYCRNNCNCSDSIYHNDDIKIDSNTYKQTK